ncbi:hypothetical protein C7377_1235 [Balneicella halophila]|uniref:Uncharacterized protein n=1 Tax=Balneicella halophila TaxID=1537566 RepID=A0A7L4UQN8_BALHA|nr:hypothetical protein C7377_1235 [Balneicella halophila]
MLQKSKIALLFLLVFIMLNSLAVWAFSFLSFFELFLIYLINLIPVGLLIYIMQKKVKQGKTNVGFIFLGAMPFKIIYIFASLLLIKKYLKLSTPFLINYLLVYFLLLYLSIFLGTRFLSQK